MAQRTNEHGKSHTHELYSARTAESLTISARIYRDAFCRSYIQDFLGARAMFRIGFVGSSKAATVRASQLLREPYVQNVLAEMVRALKPTDIVTRQQVMARMWEEANDYTFGQAKTRVAALAHVANMLGMTKAVSEEPDQPYGVLMIPCAPDEEWGATARKAQSLLKQQVSGLS